MIPGQTRVGVSFRGHESDEEVIESSDRALIFTRFAEMGEKLRRYLEETFGRKVFLVQGQVPEPQRDRMVERFQSSDGQGSSLFVLSVKAGGTGLNLAAANHVFHFDRGGTLPSKTRQLTVPFGSASNKTFKSINSSASVPSRKKSTR